MSRAAYGDRSIHPGEKIDGSVCAFVIFALNNNNNNNNNKQQTTQFNWASIQSEVAIMQQQAGFPRSGPAY